MSLTLTHTKTCANDFLKEFPKEWEYQLKFTIKLYEQFVNTWVNMAKEKQLPVMFIRFEDLIKDKSTTVKDIFKFIYGVESIEGTYLERRIDEVLAAEVSLYNPRSGKVQANLHYYTEAQIGYIKRMLRNQLNFFGYTKLTDKENPYGFFNLDDATPEEIENHEGFRKFNEENFKFYL
mmetsp:Transcript_404/g.252  ORF Transcript_404/g.252 Transcript_404/m.252 type:complete len:178 (+) Transcript_404:403-936(+)